MNENYANNANAMGTCNQERLQMPNKLVDLAGTAKREPTAREVIECALKEVHEHIDGLNELLNALPAKLPWRADRALARLISAALRK